MPFRHDPIRGLFSALEPGALEGIEKLEQLRALEHGYRIHVGITDQPTIGIDTPEDIAAFEAVLAGTSAKK